MTHRRRRWPCPSTRSGNSSKRTDWPPKPTKQGVAAREANQNSDNYVLTAVLFAAVLFFSGVASKLENRWNRLAVKLVGIIGVLVGAVILLRLPILI
jgi:hypothetical protein